MELFSVSEMRALVTPLLAWYDRAKRQMPWRDDVSPYHTWVSEIMLQQTRVEAVRGYYDRFMKALPTIADLAAADIEQLYKLWEGLGYYSRVRNLKKAAEIVVNDFGGLLPSDTDALERLPGIGAYTAGAIASIAFGRRAAAVDGNVVRVFARFLNIGQVISDDKSKRALASAICEIMPPDRTADFTQSLMELGALVCIPGNPKCEGCPLRAICAGYAAGTAPGLPILPPKPEKTVAHLTVCVLRSGTDVFLRKRADKGLLAGLWEPWQTDGKLTPEQLKDKLLSEGIRARSLQASVSHTHIFTHAKWVMNGYTAEVEDAPGFVRVTEEQLGKSFALPKAFAPFFKEKTK